MAMIYLARHGQIENPEGVVYTRMDEEIVLSEEGKRQVSEQAEKLKTRSIEAIYHSPLKRASQTAQILESCLHTNKLIPDARLMDTETVLQGMKLTEFDRIWGGFLYHQEILAKGGESMEEVWFRMRGVLQEIAVKEVNKSVVVVSHGDPIRIATLAIDNKPLIKEMLGNDRHRVKGINYPEKGSVTVLEVEGGKMLERDYWPATSSLGSMMGMPPRT